MSFPNVTLYQPLGTIDTTVVCLGTILFPSTPGVIQIESEQIHYDGCDSTSFFNCTRGYNSTTAASHARGVPVSFVGSDAQAGPASGIATVGEVPTADGNGGSTWQTPAGGVTDPLIVGDITIDGTSDEINGVTSMESGNDDFALTAHSGKKIELQAGDDNTKGIVIASNGDVSVPALPSVGSLATDSNGKLVAGSGAGFTPQVVSAFSNTHSTSTSTTYAAATGLSASGTLQSSGNKWRIMVTIQAATSTSDFMKISVFRGATNLANGGGTNAIAAQSLGSDAGVSANQTISFIITDAPGDTSAHTYTVQFRSNDGTGVDVNLSSSYGGSRIILEEIKQ